MGPGADRACVSASGEGNGDSPADAFIRTVIDGAAQGASVSSLVAQNGFRGPAKLWPGGRAQRVERHHHGREHGHSVEANRSLGESPRDRDAGLRDFLGERPLHLRSLALGGRRERRARVLDAASVYCATSAGYRRKNES